MSLSEGANPQRLSSSLSLFRFRSSRVPWILSFALTAFLYLLPVSPAAAQTPLPAAPVFVNTALGGFILGYDIDQTGTEGLLAEAQPLTDGRANVAVETFDQKTGKILKIV